MVFEKGAMKNLALKLNRYKILLCITLNKISKFLFKKITLTLRRYLISKSYHVKISKAFMSLNGNVLNQSNITNNNFSLTPPNISKNSNYCKYSIYITSLF